MWELKMKFAELSGFVLIYFVGFFFLFGTFHPTEDFNELIFPPS